MRKKAHNINGVDIMKKMMNVISPAITVCCLATTSYLVMKNKKTMLDVIIEEIETMK